MFTFSVAVLIPAEINPSSITSPTPRHSHAASSLRSLTLSDRLANNQRVVFLAAITMVMLSVGEFRG